MNNPINVSEVGGLVAVITGKGVEVPKPFNGHPQVLTLQGSELPEHAGELSAAIPMTTKIVIIAGDLPISLFGQLRLVLPRRNLTYLQRKNPEAILEALRICLPGNPRTLAERMAEKPAADAAPDAAQAASADAPQQLNAKKGQVSGLVAAEADLSKGSAEEARRLFTIAQRRGIMTTIPSLAQAISQAKRKGGRGDVPRSLMSAQQKALETLDEAIAGLQLIREWVAKTDEENKALRFTLARLREVMAPERA